MRDYSFGNFLNGLRVRRGLTQHQLGALVGVSDKAVSKWENGSSKPQISALYKISEVLGVSVDELLTCKYHSFDRKEEQGVFAMKKQLWDKVFNIMGQRYGDFVPVEIVNRVLTEQAEMQNTDMIVYLDMLSVLSTEATKRGEHIRVSGGTGASFVAYLLGATEINPLKPHYYCPKCHTVVFDNSVYDGWDLTERKCACGKEMERDGHNIPFESYLHVVRRNTSFDISVSPEFLDDGKRIVQTYFKECKLTFEERQKNRIVTFTVSSETFECKFNLCAYEEFSRYKALEKATGIKFKCVDFACGEALKEFQLCNTDGIIDFKTDYVKEILKECSPKSFSDLIQISGISHGTGVWDDNAKLLIPMGYSVSDLIAYRDDVFNYVQERVEANGLTDRGLAYRIMEYTRRGIYGKNEGDDSIKSALKALGAQNWFLDSIGKIKYLFPKAHGVTYVKIALILMWYKISFPKEFSDTII